jgi:1,4-alpha-glucan branching enzyme
MGGEFAQWNEWNHDGSLDWHLLDNMAHRQIQLLVGELNRLYKTEAALHELDCDPAGFRWLVVDDAEHSALVYERIAKNGERVIAALNFTPVPRFNYRVGVEEPGLWSEILNTDATELGGSGHGNLGGVEAAPVHAQGRPFSLTLTLPPLGAGFQRR